MFKDSIHTAPMEAYQAAVTSCQSDVTRKSHSYSPIRRTKIPTDF